MAIPFLDTVGGGGFQTCCWVKTEVPLLTVGSDTIVPPRSWFVVTAEGPVSAEDLGAIGFLNGRFESRVTNLAQGRRYCSAFLTVLDAERRDSDYSLARSNLERVETPERTDEWLEYMRLS